MILSSALSLLIPLLHAAPARASAFSVVKDYSGTSFFDDWAFYNYWDNTTNGSAWYVNQSVAQTENLAYVNDIGNAIMRIDNFTTIAASTAAPINRNSVKITSTDSYSYGSLLVLDLVHMPYGCSVWPGFSTTGTDWPKNGEIDIIDNVNLATSAQYALYTTSGCNHSDPATESGNNGTIDCTEGCTVIETKPNSFGADFASSGGGVFATQIAETGVYIWFWSREDIPHSINNATASSDLDISDFGNPSATYLTSLTSCNSTNFLGAQQVVFDITMCGSWAGLLDAYNPSCTPSGSARPGSPNQCYENNVVGNGSDYDNAYFEVQYLRVYSTASTNTQPTTSIPSTSNPTSTVTFTYSYSPVIFLHPSAGAIAGGAVGAIVALAVLGYLVLFFRQRNRNRNRNHSGWQDIEIIPYNIEKVPTGHPPQPPMSKKRRLLSLTRHHPSAEPSPASGSLAHNASSSPERLPQAGPAGGNVGAEERHVDAGIFLGGMDLARSSSGRLPPPYMDYLRAAAVLHATTEGGDGGEDSGEIARGGVHDPRKRRH